MLATLKAKEEIFNSNQSFQNGLVEELKQVNSEQLRLQKENRAFEEAAKQAELLAKRIEETTAEKMQL